MIKTEFLSHGKHPLSPLQRPLSLSCLGKQSAYFEIHIKPGKTSGQCAEFWQCQSKTATVFLGVKGYK